METQNDLQPNAGAGFEAPIRPIRSPRPEALPDGPRTITSATNGQRPLLELSNAMVALYKDAFGRGPIRARARFAGDDTLLVTLESSLTVAERNLVAMGEHRRLRETRLFLLDALEDQLRAIVEQALGRKTLAFVSGIDTSRDVTIKVFTLEPDGGRLLGQAVEH